MMSSQAFRLGGRPIFLLKGALGAGVALAAISFSTGSAQAACAPGTPAGTCRVTVGGLQYDVTTFTGSYNGGGDTNKFAPPPAPGVMPWWGDQSKATAFATAVGDGLGAPNGGSTPDGPYFAYEYDPNYNSGFGPSPAVLMSFRSNSANPPAVISSQYNPSGSAAWAQAALVSSPAAPAAAAPGPLPLFGAAAAFGFSRRLRKRIEGARLPIGSSQPLA
jgi:hypothetical protein